MEGYSITSFINFVKVIEILNLIGLDIRIAMVINCSFDFGLSIKASSAYLPSANSDLKYQLPRWDTNDFWNNEFRKPINSIS